MQETLTWNTHEQKRVMVLKRILAGQLSAAEAAVLLQMSQRQVQRILPAYRKEGVAAVVQGKAKLAMLRSDVTCSQHNHAG